MLNVSEPSLGADEKQALIDVIDSGWITMGERVRLFEVAFAELHGGVETVAVSSCTAGLHLIMHCLGIGAGDEVLVPALTFAATPNSVVYVGAKPVFVDISSGDEPLMSLNDASDKCTSRTKAVVLVHYAGYLTDPEPWRRFAADRGLHLIEDAAHASGVAGAGSFGTAAAFSFYGNKNMTTAEGGAVTTRDPQLADLIRRARGHGLTTGTFQRHGTSAKSYDVTMLGYNYRLDELRAALGLVQLRKLPQWNARRRELTEEYRRLLAQHCPSVGAPFGHLATSAHHIMPVLLPLGSDRVAMIEKLRNAGIQTSVHYPAAHQLSFYREKFPGITLPLTEDFADRELTLPLHPKLTANDVETVVLALAETLAN